MWVRGLKLSDALDEERKNSVAPYVGAWIETFLERESNGQASVAPYVGAWIET